jgi:hypothetical protein
MSSFNQKQNLRADFESQFGHLTAKQLWTLTKLAKMVRLRCRNNTAFNNAMNEIFPHAKFQTVNKSRISRLTGQPETYPGLQITVASIAIPVVSNSLVTVPAETISADEGEE